MNTKKHKIPTRKSIRLKGYDYSNHGLYYITICTKNRKCIFGDIVGAGVIPPITGVIPPDIGSSNPQMKLNNFGIIVNQWWQKTPQRFQNTQLDKFQIMPNHMHGIIHIVQNGRENRIGRENRAPTSYGRGSSRPTLGQIIAYFKYQSTKYINDHCVRAGIIPSRHVRAGVIPPYRKIWQRNFYEHIIRTESDLEKIRAYINNNPKTWDRDRNNPKNIRIISLSNSRQFA